MFNLIVAVDSNYGIGYQGSIQWKSSADMKHFRNTTMGHAVIMGGNTWRSLGCKPLAGRYNIVISRASGQTTVNSPVANSLVTDHIVVNSPEDAMQSYQLWHKNNPAGKAFIIGGSQIYKWFVDRNLITESWVTWVDGKFPADCHFNTSFTTSAKETILVDKADFCRTNASQIPITIAHYKHQNKEEMSMMSIMKQMLAGNKKSDRTGCGTMSVFGRQLRFNLSNGKFPLMTTRKLFFRGIFEELMFYLRGQTDNSVLVGKGVNVWTANTTREWLDKRGLKQLPVGDMGHSYGFSFRHFGGQYHDCKTDYDGVGFDQLTWLVNEIKTNPDSRRLRISLWEPNKQDQAALPPCLEQYQFYVTEGKLSCMMTQRSSDYFTAAGWNVATGALFTVLLASVTGLEPDELIWNIGDCHIYSNLIDQANEQLKVSPVQWPLIVIKNKKTNITDWQYTDIELVGYFPQAVIKTIMNV